MQFTLTYEGPLPAKGSATAKDRIRESFEPQLKEVWTHSPLIGFAASYLAAPTEGKKVTAITQRFGHTYAAICSEQLGIGAELDILMLRASRPGEIVVGGGDIDNRLKTLFDALSAPAQQQQVTANARPTSLEDPLYVLLDDDRLITRVNVETDRLLAAPDPDIVRLFIRVNTRITKAMLGNMGL